MLLNPRIHRLTFIESIQDEPDEINADQRWGMLSRQESMCGGYVALRLLFSIITAQTTTQSFDVLYGFKQVVCNRSFLIFCIDTWYRDVSIIPAMYSRTCV